MELEVMRTNDEETAIYTEEQLVKKYGINLKEDDCVDVIKKKIGKSCHCSGNCAKEIFQKYIPILEWLPGYKWRKNLLYDFLAGITVGVVHLPQGMAYALLAYLPPVTGLYVSFFPVLVYMIFGTSRQISIGTFAVVSLMIAQVISDKVPECNSEIGSTEVTTLSYNVSAAPNTSCDTLATRKLQVAVALAVVNGIIQMLMFFLRLGIITTYLSTSLVSGFTCAAAFHVLTSQVPKLLGVEVARRSGSFALIYTYIEVFDAISTTNVATVVVSICCIAFLVIGKIINWKLEDRLRIPIPWELGIVIFATVASYFGRLNSKYAVDVVGNIPTGVQTSVPEAGDIASVFVSAIPIAVVAFATEISLSQMFAVKRSYKIRPDQELLALGMGNIVGSFFQCFPCAPSLSRSAICDEAGGKTQLSGLFSSAFVLVILLWMGPLFESLPQAALAAIIVVNLKNLLKQFEKIPNLWRVNKSDAVVWVVSWLSVILLGVSIGLAAAVAFQIFTVVLKIQCTDASLLALVGNSGEYRDIKKFRSTPTTPGVSIIRYSTPLIYVNRKRFRSQVVEMLGFDPSLSQKKSTEAEMLNAPGPSGITRYDSINEVSPHPVMESDDDGISLSQSLTGNIDEDKDAIESKKNFNTSCVILDLSCCPYVDNDGAITLKELHQSLHNLEIKFFLVGVTVDVRLTLESLYANDDLPHFFFNIPEALEIATGRAEARLDS